MQKNDFQKALVQARAVGEKRKFVQKFDLVVNLRDIDLKQNENQKDLFVVLPFSKGKPVKVCAIVGPELTASAKTNMDAVVTTEEFPVFLQEKKKIRKLAQSCDFFVAQANIMPEIAKVFGRVLGPRGKMPNPKAGCVVPPNANLKPLVDKLRKTVKLSIKTQLSVKAMVGSEQMPDAEVLENIMTVYEAIVKALPSEVDNVRSVLIKRTMSPPVKVGAA